MRKYFVLDFQGYIYWKKLDDGSYVVDPLYLDVFKTIFCDAIEVVV